MKEVICTARNLMVVPDEEHTVRPMIEAIVVVSEPQFRFDRGGQLANERETETIRFSASPEALRKMAKSFNEWADEADGFAESLGLKKEQKDASAE